MKYYKTLKKIISYPTELTNLQTIATAAFNTAVAVKYGDTESPYIKLRFLKESKPTACGVDHHPHHATLLFAGGTEWIDGPYPCETAWGGLIQRWEATAYWRNGKQTKTCWAILDPEGLDDLCRIVLEQIRIFLTPKESEAVDQILSQF